MTTSQLIRSLGLLCLLLLSSTAWAQRSAQAELKAAALHLSHADGTQIAFNAETFGSGRSGSTPLSAGTLIVKGNQFRLSFGQMTAVYDGKKTLSYYDASEHTLNISHPTSAELAMINPLIILTQAESGYRTEMLPAAKGSNIIGLTPKTSNGIKRIELQVSAQGSRPIGAVIILQDGSRIVTRITGISAAKTSPALFRLNKADYPGVEVVDLR